MRDWVKKHVNPIVIQKIKRTIGFINKISIYAAPFFLCAIAIAHGILYLCEYKGVLLYITGEITGHSIFVVYTLRILTPKMCKWYKRSCNILLIYHVFNIIVYILMFKYGRKIVSPVILIYSTLIFSTASLIVWFVSDTCRKTRLLINQFYKRV